MVEHLNKFCSKWITQSVGLADTWPTSLITYQINLRQYYVARRVAERDGSQTVGSPSYNRHGSSFPEHHRPLAHVSHLSHKYHKPMQQWCKVFTDTIPKDWHYKIYVSGAYTARIQMSLSSVLCRNTCMCMMTGLQSSDPHTEY